MERPSSAARRRTVEFPAKPEAGLAEWTSKIKALQRQVDADEEDEQRRLEEEIAASRAARLRRSGGYTASTISVPEPARSELAAEPSPADRQENQKDALRRLMGERRGATLQLHGAVPPAAGDAMSLAAFIGGRASGPRLTRHAPQQDAHDPTQFEQRAIAAPHPVFGRGGVAMPGMVKGRREPEPDVPPQSALTASNAAAERDRKIGSPSVVRSHVERAEKQAVPERAAATSSYRQRTISTPTGSPIAPTASRPSVEPSSSRQTSVTPAVRPITPASRPITPAARPMTPHERPKSAASRTASPVTSPVTHSFPPVRTSPSISVVPASSPKATSPKSTAASPKSNVATPSLARPIQPSPRASLGPQIPSTNLSPAFLRAPPSKEPTPSISRLQGRGFVQSMVRATSQIGDNSAPNAPSPPPAERRDSAGKKLSVLDRWQHAPTPTSPSPPIISPKPAPMRKSMTVDHSRDEEPPSPAPFKPDYTGRSLKSMASLPSLSPSRTEVRSKAVSDIGIGDGGPIRLPGLGSSKTKVAYIEPSKTGEAAWPRPQAAPEVDELGVRRGGAGAIPARAGKPLSHLTKDRAKKPRKTRTGDGTGRTATVAFAAEAAVEVKTVPEPAPPSPATQSLAPDIPQRTSPTTEVSLGPAPPSPVTEKPLVAPKPALGLGRKPAPSIDTAIASPAEDGTAPLLSPPARSPQPNQRTPPSPRPRIPSTGNRATVMDVAQVFQELDRREPSPAPATSPGPVPSAALPIDEASGASEEPEEEIAGPDVKSLVAGWGQQNGALRPPPAIERRKSSHDKYPSLPPLQEEKTPIPSPAGTLSRASGQPLTVQESIIIEEKVISIEAASTPTTLETIPVVAPAVLAEAPEAPQDIASETKIVHIEHSAEPLPAVDVDALLGAAGPSSVGADELNPISVDVMSVIGNTATPITRHTHVVYDNELLAIVYRAKARSTGLVSTKVWAWQGKKATVGDREDRKLQELARRYGTSPITVHQYCEPPDLVNVLGGTLITRQGTRAHWTAENTAMHVVRSIMEAIYIDELDFGIHNLCSGFSFCLSLLDTLYVWHGCGSTESERRAALEYGKSLSSQSSTLIELIEGESDSDEMFWMILGEGEYAKADYWKWRPAAGLAYPRRWVVDVQNSKSPVQPVSSFTDEVIAHESVFIIDCIWEFFVLVGMEARGKRQDIQLALLIAETMSSRSASSKPFTPTVHVLILPTKIPADLRLSLRELDESALNCGIIPDHMNLTPATEAQMHLGCTAWESSAVQDSTMLPVGVHSSNML